MLGTGFGTNAWWVVSGVTGLNHQPAAVKGTHLVLAETVQPVQPNELTDEETRGQTWEEARGQTWEEARGQTWEGARGQTWEEARGQTSGTPGGAQPSEAPDTRRAATTLLPAYDIPGHRHRRPVRAQASRTTSMQSICN